MASYIMTLSAVHSMYSILIYHKLLFWLLS